MHYEKITDDDMRRLRELRQLLEDNGVHISDLDAEADQTGVRIRIDGVLDADEWDYPSATLSGEEVTLQDLVEAWESKATNATLDPNVRAAYNDAAEKLEAVMRGGSLTERP